MTSHRGRLTAIIGIVLAAAVGFAVAFSGIKSTAESPASASSRQSSQRSPVRTGSEIDTSRPLWYEPYVTRDKELPRPTQLLNGITIGDSVDQTPRCPEGALSRLTEDDLKDPEWRRRLPTVTTIPADARLDHEEAVLCEGELVWYGVGYTLPTDEQRLQQVADGEVSWFDVPHGGFVAITYSRTDDPSVSMPVPEERLRVESLNSSLAVVAEPIIDEGFGEGFVASWTDGWLLILSTMHVSTNDLLAIATGVFK